MKAYIKEHTQRFVEITLLRGVDELLVVEGFSFSMAEALAIKALMLSSLSKPNGLAYSAG